MEKTQFTPAKFNVFKGKSAMRLSIAKPKADFQAGFLYCEVAQVKGQDSNGNRIYDWENKIGIKLGIVDLSKMAYALEYGQSCDLFHNFNGDTKSIKLMRQEGGTSPYFFSVSAKSKDGKQSQVSVPIASEEAYSLLVLLKHSIPAIHGW